MFWKRLFLVSFISSFFSFIPISKADVNQWTSIGIPAASPAAIAYDPNSPNIVYVSIPDLSTPDFLPTGTLYKSTDGGQIWSEISSPENTAVINFAFDENTPGLMYVTTFLGVYKSSDEGSSWTSISSGLPSTGPFPGETVQPIMTYSITVDPNDSNVLYVGLTGIGINFSTLDITGSSGVYKSVNGGASWTSISTGLPDPLLGSIYTSIVVDPGNSNILYTSTRVAGGGSGIFKSTDAGANWSAINGNALDDSGTVTSSTGTTLTDTTKTWTPNIYAGATLRVTDSLGVEDIRTITSNTSDTLTVDSSFTASIDNTSQYFILTGLPHASDGSGGFIYTNINQLIINPSTPNTLYASAGIELNFSGLDGGIFKTTDGGANWTAVNTGLPVLDGEIDGNPFTYHYSFALALDPSNPNTLYTGSGLSISLFTNGFLDAGLFKTTNGGTSWSTNGNAFQGMFAGPIVIKPTDPSTLLSGTAGCGVFQSTDFGSHWDMNNTGLIQRIYNSAEDSFVFTSQIKSDPHNASNIVAGSGCGILVSSNLGVTWGTLNKGLTNIFLTALTIDPTSSGVMYAGTLDGLFKYTTLSNTWFQVASDSGTSGLTDQYIVDVQINPTNPSIVYVLTPSGPFKSTDGGYTWTLMADGLNITGSSFISLFGFANVLRIDPKDPNTIYITSGDQGVLKSTDGATSWTEMNNGLPQPPSGIDVEIDPVNTDILYTTTAEGVYKSIDGGNSWTSANNGLPSVNLNSFSLPLYVGIDPTTPDTLYVTVFGNGIYSSGDAGESWSAFNEGLTNLETIAFGMDGTGDNLYITTFPATTVTGISLKPNMNTMRDHLAKNTGNLRYSASAGSGSSSGIYRYQFASGTISGTGGSGSGAACATTCSLNLLAKMSVMPMLIVSLNILGLGLLRKRRKTHSS